jgi:hypothetical protein
MIETENKNTAFETGKAFYEDKLQRLNKELPILQKEGNVYGSVVKTEEIELATLHLNWLNRRKDKGLLK